jgi:transmembrane sensor
VANSEDQDSDEVWHTAVEWVIREHESLSSAEREELIGWLNMNPAHRKAYDEAARLWLLTGLVPPSEPADE